jgi:hypothetical protein
MITAKVIANAFRTLNFTGVLPDLREIEFFETIFILVILLELVSKLYIKGLHFYLPKTFWHIKE